MNNNREWTQMLANENKGMRLTGTFALPVIRVPWRRFAVKYLGRKCRNLLLGKLSTMNFFPGIQ